MIKTAWQKAIRDTIILLIIFGIIIGLYFASLTGPAQTFEWGVFFIYLFIAFVASLIIIYIYWTIKRKRETLSPKKIKTIEAIRMTDLISDEEHVLNDKIKPILNNISVQDIKDSEGTIPRVTFKFHKDHKFNFLYNLSIEVFSSDDIRLNAILRQDYPISLSIKRKTHQETQSTNESQIESSQFFSFHTSHPVAFKEIFTKKEFDKLLLEIKDTLTNLVFNGKFVETSFTHFSALLPLFGLITFIHDELMLKDFGDMEVEQLTCYECGDIFETDENKCNKCGAPRPRCIVCLLDLKFSEKDKVIRTPCCDVFAHRHHLINWLETNPTCPNCKKDLFLLLRTLKKNNG